MATGIHTVDKLQPFSGGNELNISLNCLHIISYCALCVYLTLKP